MDDWKPSRREVPTVNPTGTPDLPRAVTPIDTARSFMDDTRPFFTERLIVLRT